MNKFEELLHKLEKANLTLGSVESMTGGGFANEITQISGSSRVFKGALITYHSSLKITLADVDKDTIENFGVVSSNVAEQMASGGRKKLDCDVCVAITGNAGPGKCIGNGEVGDFYIGVCYLDHIESYFFHFNGSSDEIKRLGIYSMANAVLDFLKTFL